MAKRDKNVITLGSGKLYMSAYSDILPTPTAICVDENLVGYIKGGASLEYSQETYEEKDDLGHVSKIITTNEEVLLKAGLLTWNGATLKKLIDRCTSMDTIASDIRTTKIGGIGNAQGGYWAICFHHADSIDGDVWVMIKGRNNAGVTITFSPDSGSVIEPEFKAMPHDKDGTLVEFIESIITT